MLAAHPHHFAGNDMAWRGNSQLRSTNGTSASKPKRELILLSTPVATIVLYCAQAFKQASRAWKNGGARENVIVKA